MTFITENLDKFTITTGKLPWLLSPVTFVHLCSKFLVFIVEHRFLVVQNMTQNHYYTINVIQMLCTKILIRKYFLGRVHYRTTITNQALHVAVLHIVKCLIVLDYVLNFCLRIEFSANYLLIIDIVRKQWRQQPLSFI